MTLYTLDLERVKVNDRSEYRGQWLFREDLGALITTRASMV